MRRFPKDCWSEECPHFNCWDMSIDDLCCYCDLLRVQIDACDEDRVFVFCPLGESNGGDGKH